MLRLSGIVPPVVTPLLQHDQLDPDAVGRIVEHLISGGVNGLFVLGTTGEGPSLSYQVRYQMVERSCEAADGRVPVLVGVTDSSLAESIQLANHAESAGAAAIVAAAPYYFPTNQQAVADWFRQLADRSPLPLVLYNMPGCVRISLAVETVADLSKHPNIIGVKDSSGDLNYFQQLCDHFADNSDFAVFMGPEELIPEAVAAGADGGVCGGGNLLPHVYVNMFNAAKAGDDAEVIRVKAIVSDVFSGIYFDPDGQMNLIPALKLAMSHCGLCRAEIAPPLQSPTPDHAQQVGSQLAGILESSASPLTLAHTA
ncbi:dihydrodipicolinate synthase family protein [Fuerstiella marisgermanici]|uniref:Putative 2-keto-3-deoxy-galactonate aldolase YagE n=1 Tax=Fuerstiella marisgermanici TaxID=1891926 RepID=A0A1P8WHF6_9PLAN|nr:dihydrodipicolinate synthase family protein [Fuerstiella marisgermanici]APZ93499.1 putative 2-keto-3-deoxy-galactonate aldolase YagE [Fuerstiella marisgermanici]